MRLKSARKGLSTSGEPVERAKKAVSIKERKMDMFEGFFFEGIVKEESSQEL